MFDFNYWFKKCKRIYHDCLNHGYVKSEAYQTIETMMHTFDSKYGSYVIISFLHDFVRLVVIPDGRNEI